MADLRQWLESIGLGRYADLLAANDIDQEVLSELSELDLQKLGISLGHRKKLIKAIKSIGSQSDQSERIDGVRQLSRTTGVKAGRRHLTVLFCDLVGSTALSVGLDPEDLRHILLQFQNRCSDQIRSHGGHVARFMGDGVLAYFGFPTAHEDDAEEALNAALNIRDSVSGLNFAKVPRLRVRVGIATGLVVVGDLIGEGPASEFAIVGEAPNLAALLQQLAEPNQILITSSTKRLVGKAFELDDAGEYPVKGISHTVHAWRVIKANPIETRFDARQTSHVTPLVGRDSELRLLQDLYAKAKSGKGQFVLISGEPGIGKSRLIVALCERLHTDRHNVMTFQCSSHHTSSAWSPLLRYLEDILGIGRDTVPAVKLERLERLADQYLKETRLSSIPLLAALLSIPTDGKYQRPRLNAEEQKKRTFATLLNLFHAHARRRPAIVIFEDVHWIDPTSMQLLEQLRNEIKKWRMLVILSFRLDLTLPWVGEPHVTSFTLNRLNRAQVHTMIRALAAGKVRSRTISDQIAVKSDGVPLFVEEMTKAAAEATKPKGTNVGSDLRSAIAVPDTLHESLMAQLDQLASMKLVAQIAAVIGREFSLDLLETITPLSANELRAAIDRLLATGLVFRSSPIPDRVYAFKHTLLQDEAYDSMLREERREIHGRIAATLSSRFSETIELAPEIIAHHYSNAGQLQPAIDFWSRAGRRASERSAFAEASLHFQAAVDLLTGLPSSLERDRLELDLQHALGSALAASKGYGASRTSKAFKRASELCGRLDQSAHTFSVLNGLIGVHVARGEFEESRKVAEDLLERAGRQDDPTARLMGDRALGMSLFLIGDLAAARAHLQDSLARHGPSAIAFSQDFKATAQAYLALASVLLGEISAGLAHGRDAVIHAEGLGHPHSICYALCFLAGAHVLCLEPDAVGPIANRIVTLASEYGFPLWLAGGRMLGGWARTQLGDIKGGLTEVRQSVSALESAGAPIWGQFARLLLAQALAKANRTDDADKLVDQILREVSGTSGRWYEAELYRLKGDLLYERNEFAAAETAYERAIAVAARQGARLWQLRATRHLALLWRAQGRAAEAYARLAPLYADFADGDGSPDVTQADAVLRLLRGARASERAAQS